MSYFYLWNLNFVFVIIKNLSVKTNGGKIQYESTINSQKRGKDLAFIDIDAMVLKMSIS